MEVKDYMRLQLDNAKRGVTRVLDGLNQGEMQWRPTAGCNSIGLILFHTAKSEDSFVQGRLQGKPEVFAAEKWYQKLNLAENEAGAHYTVDQVNCFPVPPLKDIMAYYDAVRARTLDYLQSLTPDKFDAKITMPRFGEMSIAGVFAIIIGHTSQHIGEMGYLRGLQRGMDK